MIISMHSRCPLIRAHEIQGAVNADRSGVQRLALFLPLGLLLQMAGQRFLPEMTPRVPFSFAWHCASVQPVERVSSCISVKMKGRTMCLVLNENRNMYLGVWFNVISANLTHSALNKSQRKIREQTEEINEWEQKESEIRATASMQRQIRDRIENV